MNPVAEGPVAAARSGAVAERKTELKIYMHSWLFYWWPLWAVGFAMAAWTMLEDRHVALVPPGSVVAGQPPSIDRFS